jgi:aminopeptidase
MKTFQELTQAYAKLLVEYAIYLQPGEKIFVNTTTLAEPLLIELHKEIIKAGAHPDYSITFPGMEKNFLENASDKQLSWVSPVKKFSMETYDAYLGIGAPFPTESLDHIDKEKRKKVKQAQNEIFDIYFKRLGVDLKRTSCQWPTQANADLAEMSLEEYQEFVFNAMHLYDKDPKQAWLELSDFQQKIVDHLNQCEEVHYVGPNCDIKFNVKDRIWQNSDGKNNMPSGEVFTSPVEDSVNGWIKFSLPGYYMQTEVEGVELQVKDGYVTEWKATKGKDFLDEIFAMEGARYFGEVAIGTNKNIQRITKNILFDEKIGGTVHMAIGQSYLNCGGKNQSAVHWDMITDMTDGGKIFADDELIYENGSFLI